MRLTHVSLTALDAKRLSAFYVDVFGCTLRREARQLKGEAVERGNGLPGCEITSIWLDWPEVSAPFLEIMEYHGAAHSVAPRVDRRGWAHLALVVEDIQAVKRRILAAGGSAQGEVTDFGTKAHPYLIIYMRDPEGNVLELEQPA